jgi:hypothetical protein
MKVTWMIYASFPMMRLFFHKYPSFSTFNTLFPTLSTMLYTGVVKFPALLRSGSRKLFFSSLSSAKWLPHSENLFLHRIKQVTVGRCQMWAVSRLGKNSASHFCDCLTRVRPGIVVKEKDVFHVSVRTTLRKRCSSSGAIEFL